MVSNNTKCFSQTGFLDFTLTCEVTLLPPCLCSSCSFCLEQLPLIFLPSEINISFRSHLFSKSQPNAFFLFWIPVGFCDSIPLWSQEVEKHGWECFSNRKVFSEVVIARAYFLGKDTINAFLYLSTYSFSSDLCGKKKKKKKGMGSQKAWGQCQGGCSHWCSPWILDWPGPAGL